MHIEPIKARESVIERITLPVTPSQLERYRHAANELDKRRLTKLHELMRAKLDLLLSEVEEFLAKSS